jgi:hypothetical protein
MKKMKHLLLFVVCSMLSLTSIPAQNYSTCNRWDYWNVNGYTIYNNIWGDGYGTQCLWANSQSDWGVWANHPNYGGIKSYPNVEKKVNYTVSSMPDITASFNTTSPNWGAYNTAFDIWYDNYAYEIMLWVNWQGSVGPISYNYGCNGYPSTACPSATNVYVGGHTWNVYRGHNGSNVVYSFLRTSNTTSGTVNITEISKWLANNSYFGWNTNLHSIQFGWEITSCSGGADFRVSSYSVNIGSSSSGYVQIQNRANGLMIDGMGRTSNGSTCSQWSNSGSYNQQWLIEDYNGYKRIKNRATGLYIDGYGYTNNGAVCKQYGNSGHINQQWTMEYVDGYVKFKNRATGLYIDSRFYTNNGSDLGQWGNSSSTAKHFKLINVSASYSPEVPTAIKSQEKKNIAVYPNPLSDGKLKIDLSGTTGVSKIKLLDLSGKVIKQISTSDQSVIYMDVNAKPGIYTIQILNNNKVITEKLIVK